MSPDDPAADLARRDEVLQLLYWIEGEGFSGAATSEALARFLAVAPADVEHTLARLEQRGDVTRDAVTGEYRLTPDGLREAGRRFADEFAPLLGQGHGECNDPDCDCHANPAAAAECHARRGESSGGGRL